MNYCIREDINKGCPYLHEETFTTGNMSRASAKEWLEFIRRRLLWLDYSVVATAPKDREYWLKEKKYYEDEINHPPVKRTTNLCRADIRCLWALERK